MPNGPSESDALEIERLSRMLAGSEAEVKRKELQLEVLTTALFMLGQMAREREDRLRAAAAGSKTDPDPAQ